MLSILPCQPIDPLVETEEYWSTSSSCEEEEKKRGRCREGSIYRREEALRVRDLVSTNKHEILVQDGLDCLPKYGVSLSLQWLLQW